jgi:putative membrane protein
MRAFATGGNRRSGRFYRVINEVPAAIMVAVVILVIVRPL